MNAVQNFKGPQTRTDRYPYYVRLKKKFVNILTKAHASNRIEASQTQIWKADLSKSIAGRNFREENG